MTTARLIIINILFCICVDLLAEVHMMHRYYALNLVLNFYYMDLMRTD